jgi:hypothetical protein
MKNRSILVWLERPQYRCVANLLKNPKYKYCELTVDSPGHPFRLLMNELGDYIQTNLLPGFPDDVRLGLCFRDSEILRIGEIVMEEIADRTFTYSIEPHMVDHLNHLVTISADIDRQIRGLLVYKEYTL